MKKALKITGYVLVALVAGIAAGVIYLQYAFPNVDAAPVITIEKTPALVARGEYLANHVTVCIDCHSTRDFSRFSGPPVAGTEGKGGDKFDHSMGFPGTFYARNISSDKETGIGSWAAAAFVQRFKMHAEPGKVEAGAPNTIMPWSMYAGMQEEDLHAIYKYLMTLEPNKNNVTRFTPTPKS